MDEPRNEAARSDDQRVSDDSAKTSGRTDEVKIWNSQQILGNGREAIILHGDQAYRLLCTRNGKLILQK